MSTAEMNSSRKHAYTDAGIPQLPEPTYSERVRTLVSLCTIATLSTVSRKRSGYPFGSLMPYAIDGTGRPIFLISNMAMHTQNIQADHRASLFVSQGGDANFAGTVDTDTMGKTEVDITQTALETATSTSGATGRFLYQPSNTTFPYAIYVIDSNNAVAIPLGGSASETDPLLRFIHQ